MGKILRFEDLIAWQKARVLTRDIYAITRREPFRRDFGLCNQIQRAAVSVSSNLAEGFDRGKRTEFHQFACIAKGSCAEVRSQLYVALDLGYIDENEFNALYAQAAEVSRIVAGLRLSLAKPPIKPPNNKR